MNFTLILLMSYTREEVKVDRDLFYSLMNNSSNTDYEKYLNTKELFACQKKIPELCHPDELQFQIVHQVEELWMRLIITTLLDIDDYLQRNDTYRVLTLFKRIHITQQLMLAEFQLLETMSPKEYQKIREALGNGSGQESPGFKTILRMGKPLWASFKKHYLDDKGLTVEKIYDSQYCHDESYMVAEALIEFDALFQEFRRRHFMLVQRVIGVSVKSLKGRSVDLMLKGAVSQFFPELWEVRCEMTAKWGQQYGVVRPSITDNEQNPKI